MMHLEWYVTRIKPAIEAFLKAPSKDTLSLVEREIEGFNFGEMRIYQVQTLVPLVLKLDELSGENQELRTSLMNCLSTIVSRAYLADVKGLRSILVVVMKQIVDSKSATMRPDLSEEIKLAAVVCIFEALRRSTSDVLESFYSKETAMLIGQILITLLKIIEHEKYRKLVQSALKCLMVVFYVHDGSDSMDVVLRSQVANTIFIFLPKVLIVLFKTSIKDDKVGETIKSMSIQALGRIICIMFEETTEEFMKLRYDIDAFRILFNSSTENSEPAGEFKYFTNKKASAEENEERLHEMQSELRSLQWIKATSRRLRPIFVETSILRAHPSLRIRESYAEMCCLLLSNCVHNLSENFLHILESVMALTEDENEQIAQRCRNTLIQLQQQPNSQGIFDENAEMLLDAHLNKWPRILHRCEDNEQFAELLFFKGFLQNVQSEKLQLLLLVPKNLEMFVNCLLMALDLRPSRDLLNEEYSLRQIRTGNSKELQSELSKLQWRQFKYLTSKRTVDILYDIAALLGADPTINRVIFDYCQEQIQQRSAAMNESVLLLTLMITMPVKKTRESRLMLAQLLLDQLLREEHWNLSLKPDASWRLKVEKPTNWFKDHTPGLYSSAVEIRTQDCDSDDEELTEVVSSRVNIADAQFNVLHTCLVLDAIGHCAKFIGDTFDRYIFQSLHKVLLKVSSSNTIVYQAASFAFVSMQLALKYAEPSHFIECSTDYITFHLNSLLKKSPESPAAVDILTVVLQYSTRGNVPHLDSIFQTIREECSKRHQKSNVHSYLRVFNAFLKHITTWQYDTMAQVNSEHDMQVDEDKGVLDTWMSVLQKPRLLDDLNGDENMTEVPHKNEEDAEEAEAETEPAKPTLPRHIEMVKYILGQVIKFISTDDQAQQIAALECFASGVPLLADYENELLPLVHLVWQPLVEKFRQKDALVLNRCFTLLHLLGVHSKEFIFKRSLTDVIPQLKQFLQVAAKHSKMETSLAKTQEYKLQVKLLQSLSDFIISLQIDGKHFHELLSTIVLYLSQEQPQELQALAKDCILHLVSYNGPFLYVTLLQRAHLKDYKNSVSQILGVMGFSLAKGGDLD